MMRLDERELRDDLAAARLRPDENARHRLIFEAVNRIVDDGTVYHVLTDTPEQTSDVFRVLVDDRLVVGFELTRGATDATPIDVQIYSVEEYRRAIGRGIAEQELRIASELARDSLSDARTVP